VQAHGGLEWVKSLAEPQIQVDQEEAHPAASRAQKTRAAAGRPSFVPRDRGLQTDKSGTLPFGTRKRPADRGWRNYESCWLTIIV
jgi:hypothetical protein